MGKKTYIDQKGYFRFINTGKSVHRWVVEKIIGEKIPQDIIVHHVDGNKLNNDPSNLMLMSNRDHSLLHAWERSNNGISSYGYDDNEDEDEEYENSDDTEDADCDNGGDDNEDCEEEEEYSNNSDIPEGDGWDDNCSDY